MQARETTLDDLFDGGVKYVSPSFQRPYNWARAHCDRFLALLGEAPAAPAAAPAVDPPAPQPLFFGGIVVMDLGTVADGSRKRLLIDGTHRLMTALAILLALRDLLGGADDPDGRALHERFFVHTRPDGHHGFKCIVPRKDRADFEALVAGRPAPHPAAPFARAAAYVRNTLRSLSREALLDAARAFPRRVTMVELALEAHENPYPVFKLFNAPGEAFTDRGLQEYDRFSGDPEFMALVAGGESRDVEFKERAIRLGKGGCRAGGEGSFGILRAVAGFMNSAAGGTLLIGVRDDGSIRGIEDEYPLADPSKANWDGFQLYLAGRLRSRLDTPTPFRFFQIERRRVQQHDVCMVKVLPAEAPVFLDKHLYVRTGNQTLELLGPDLIDYVAARWRRKG